MLRGQSRSRLNILQHADPYALFGAIVCFVLLFADDPWWTVDGLSSGNLLSFQVSPYYLHAAATGISSTASFSGPLGFATRILLTLGFVSLAAASVRPDAWWRDIMVYFGLSALVELFLSFLLMLHAAEVMFLGAYGSSPPFIGTGQLSGSILGLDLASHVQPLVTAGFSLPLYLGLASCTLVWCSVLSGARRGNRKSKGVGAIFSSGQEDMQE